MTRSPLLLLTLVLVAGTAHADDTSRAFKKAWAKASSLEDTGAKRDAQVEAVKALGAGNSVEAAKVLANLSLQRDLEYAVRDMAQKALFGMTSPDVVLWAKEGLEGNQKDAAKRVLLCEMIAARAEHAPEAGMLLLPAVEDKQPKVQSAAIKGLGRVRRKIVIATLIRFLPRATGRVAGDCERSLRWLTGQRKGSPDEWASWWEVVQDEFSFDSALSEEEVEEDRFTTVTRLAPPGEKGTTLYDEIKSDNVIFVVDFSGSMQVRCQDKTGASRSRLDYVKTELANVLSGQLGEGDQFTLIGFSDELIPFKKKLVKGSDRNIAKAKAWVRRLRPSGETDIYGALKLAFSMKSVDTIYFLTDGIQSVDMATKTPDFIRGEVRKWNAGRGVRICTIGFLAGDGEALGIVQSKSMAKSFLKDLAKDHDGTSKFFE